MICLEKLYQETGLSRTLFSGISGVSTDALKKYEWSNTDRMRKTTIEKIETAARKCKEHSLKVTALHFGNGWEVTLDTYPGEVFRFGGFEYNSGLGFIRYKLGL